MHDTQDAKAQHKNHEKQENHRLKWVGIITLCVLVGVAGYGIYSRYQTEHTVKKWTENEAIPSVAVISPTEAPGTSTLTLPGRVNAWYQAPVYARTSGYLKIWYTDIGASVKTGQILGLIDAPDLDQQYAAAKASLATAAAQRALAQTTSDRWQKLIAEDAVSQQEADEKKANYAARVAMEHEASAEVDRLRALIGFKQLVAPFDGVVTGRATDIGALIIGGTSNANNAQQPLFTVSDIHKMRVYVNVPQAYAAQIKPGITAVLHLPEYPDRTFHATYVDTNHAVTPASGTMLVQMAAENADHALKPGSYTQVEFTLPTPSNIVRVPASAVLFRQEGMTVATIDAQNHVHLHIIKITRDLGRQIELAGGISRSDRVIDSPMDDIAENDLVRPDSKSDGAAHDK
ncbi:MAG: efflux RND transporter periplasmic adaptor subunit [Zymomonas mobilis subsp. pomaceae]|uniref:Efflux transporter, RND family, MFP subunit n=1 Tax=Zymomonas mobilis subsp. pomaceae (strain ATCC 29192 / DSM 22645 / JCM 10191 / CCUG 17912 / NBRC 13757 / NCIMB 11200 / NRRL B-4491 / Barker I) TaxID=579138 RepID=F8EVG7_ZYMMT|nr:efflux RND transporter periplasmic adaptor subunit [Zymomonas mobilis]AEI37374.1 efflux transporter, RND family, MFP subunit [Zymomonas mobilis subsp. pomaceae ATCC 29192]MDX5948742.1 efflux RND transporter periplasmic adaptor subunit [Zymomonas mobilis subsp. pomaceae]GEB88547.1 RND transporter MFP subunit [Zymomonas mobilis subsp. pomaceae]